MNLNTLNLTGGLMTLVFSSLAFAQTGFSQPQNQRTLQLRSVSVLDGLQIASQSHGKKLIVTPAATKTLHSTTQHVSVHSINETAEQVCQRIVNSLDLLVHEEVDHILLYHRADIGKSPQSCYSIGQIKFERALNSKVGYLASTPIDASLLIHQIRLATGLNVALGSQHAQSIGWPTTFNRQLQQLSLIHI